MAKLNKTNFAIRFKRGLQAVIHATATVNSALAGEPHYTTDSHVLYIYNGASNDQAGMRLTSSAADPTTTEIPNSGEFGLHKNTASGAVFLAYNDAGTIKKVQLV